MSLDMPQVSVTFYSIGTNHILNNYLGRDLQADCDGGTWLAISPSRRKLGVLLNLPRTPRPNAKSKFLNYQLLIAQFHLHYSPKETEFQDKKYPTVYQTIKLILM